MAIGPSLLTTIQQCSRRWLLVLSCSNRCRSLLLHRWRMGAFSSNGMGMKPISKWNFARHTTWKFFSWTKRLMRSGSFRCATAICKSWPRLFTSSESEQLETKREDVGEGPSPSRPQATGDPIDPRDYLIRLVNPKAHVDSPSKPPRLSSGVFAPASRDGGTSAEVESLLIADGITPLQRVEAHENTALGAVRLGVGKINELGCAAEYAPIAPGEPHGPNPYHAKIVGTRSKARRKALLDQGMWMWVKVPEGLVSAED